MEVVGYCTIKKTATTGTGLELETFIGQDVRVMEFARDGGVLVLNSKATAIATFDKEDIYRSFECSMCGEVICPPKMSLVEQTLYVGKVMLRKGGYNNLLKNMVIQASLMKGKLNDDFLFQMEREENARKERAAATSEEKPESKGFLKKIVDTYGGMFSGWDKQKNWERQYKKQKRLARIKKRMPSKKKRKAYYKNNPLPKFKLASTNTI